MNKTELDRRHVLGLGGTMALGALASPLIGPSRLAMAQGLKPAHVANARGNPTLVMQELMRQQKFFESVGLDGTQDNPGSGTHVMAALFNGSMDISVFVGITQVFSAIEAGAKVKLVAATSFQPSLAVYSARDNIKSIKDLEGKTVGAGPTGALLHNLMLAICEKQGVDHKKITFVNVGGTAQVFKAVSVGTVDAGLGTFDIYDRQQEFGVHALEGGELWNELPDYTFQAAFTTDEILAEKRDILVRILAAHAKLYRFVQSPDSKEAYVAAWKAALKADDSARPAAERQWSFYQKIKPYAVDLELSKERVDYMQRLNILVEKQKAVMPYEKVADMSMVPEALKLLS